MRQAIVVTILLGFLSLIAAAVIGFSSFVETPAPMEVSTATATPGTLTISVGTGFAPAARPAATGRGTGDAMALLRWVTTTARNLRIGIASSRDRDGWRGARAKTTAGAAGGFSVAAVASGAVPARPVGGPSPATVVPAQDYGAAVKWYAIAADRNDAEAQYRLAVAYRDGDGVERNPAAALRWLLAAAEGGDPHAQFVLGRMYAAGDGVPRDAAAAFMWLDLAASRCAPLAECDLAEQERAEVAAEMTADQLAAARRLVEARKPRAALTMVSGS